MKNLFNRQPASRSPVSVASLPGGFAAVRVHFPASDKPRVLAAAVETLQGSSADKLGAATRALRVSRDDLHLLLDAGEYQFVQTEIPAVPPEELKTALKWRIKDMLRQPVEKTTVDVMVTPDKSGGVRPTTGFVLAANNELLLDRMLNARAMRSRMSLIDVPESAQHNMASLLEEGGRAVAILAFNANGCTLTVSQGGSLFFVRSFDVSFADARQSGEARQGLFDRLMLELQRTLDIIDRQFSFLSLAALWLAPFAYRDELLPQLIDGLEVPVKAIELDSLIDWNNGTWPDTGDAQGQLFFALGLALQGRPGSARAVNLADPTLIPATPVFPLRSLVQALLGITVCLGLLSAYAAYQVREQGKLAATSQRMADAQQKRVTSLADQLARRMPDASLAEKIKQATAEGQSLEQVMNMLQSGGLLGGGAGHSPLLDGLADHLLPGVWLTEVRIVGDRYEIVGMAERAELIPRYLTELKKVAALRGRTFEVFEMEQESQASGSGARTSSALPGVVQFRLLSKRQTEQAGTGAPLP